jgi:hypothetical protein
MPSWLWVIGMMVVMPIICFIPVHLLLSRWMPQAPPAR